MENLLDGTKIELGVCYYPEHWDKSLWRGDLRRMQENGISVVRVAEFSWNLFEPEEGRFDDTFLGRLSRPRRRMRHAGYFSVRRRRRRPRG